MNFLGKLKQFFPRGFSLRGFTMHVLLLSSLPVVAIVLVGALTSYFFHQNAIREMVSMRDHHTASALAVTAAADLQTLGSNLQGLAAGFEGMNDAAEFSAARKSANWSQFDLGLALLTPDGAILNASGEPGSWEAIQHLLKSSMTSASTASSPAYLFTQCGSSPIPCVVVVCPAGEDRFLAGAASSGKVFSLLSAALQGENLPAAIIFTDEESETAVIFQQGRLKGQIFDPTSVSVSPTTLYYSMIAGKELITIHKAIPGSTAVLVLEDLWGSDSDPYLAVSQQIPLILIPMFLAAIFALWYADRQVIEPLRKLEKHTAELARGDFETILQPSGGIREVRQLQKSLASMAQELKTARDNLRSYIGALTTSSEKERSHLARELHDETLQSQIALNQRIQLAMLDATATDLVLLKELQQMVQQTMLDLRRMVRGLRPIYLEELGLVAALETLCHERQAGASLEIEFSLKGPEQRLPPEVELAYYRIAQEALSNAVSHSHAEHIQVKLEFEQNSILMSIQDNGAGFDLSVTRAAAQHSGHYGLLDLQERADLAGSHLEIHTGPGIGTNITVTGEIHS